MKFQQQPTTDSRITSQGDDEVEIYRAVPLPEEGQQNREILNPDDEDQIQSPTNEEITVELQQEDIPLNLEPIPDNVDH